MFSGLTSSRNNSVTIVLKDHLGDFNEYKIDFTFIVLTSQTKPVNEKETVISTFKGVNVTEVDLRINEELAKKNYTKTEVFQIVTCSIKSISETGLLQIKFSEKMKALDFTKIDK